ncbi:unnamed protein product [Acanthoscelides obtectus]|uniref:Uncharacterized protein n=1 Tax=Acanthoscelides obtectus TaxID=200917 RepID=A0A9P0MI91_ACAOB|nr:unnamed protein product [Acanthoscelides obtectus]CAK1680795.1 hypothetical protein AOBTE_LOCUS32882 [Acanthoscelides obtectus]
MNKKKKKTAEIASATSESAKMVVIKPSDATETPKNRWAIETILFAEVNINKFSPFGGSSYIKLPHFIEKKNAIINVQNKDEYCFAWAVTSALMPAHAHASQTSSYPHFSTILNVDGITFPANLKDISVFEKNNAISINVYGLENIIKNEVVKFALYRGEDASKKFITKLEADLKFLYFKYMKDVTPIIPLTSDEQNEFDIATICNICEKPFSGEDIKVRDHCHITGKERSGAANSK